MRRRLMVAGGALGLALGFMTMQALVLPGRVVACSCAVNNIPSLAETRHDPKAAVFTGSAGGQVGDRVPIMVERWFHGPGVADVVWVRARDIPIGENEVVTNTCGLELGVGERRFFVVHGTPPEPFHASFCSLGAPLDGNQGQQLVTEATLVFGAPAAPPIAEPSQPPVGDPSPWVGEGLVWAAAAFAIGMLLLGALTLLARRRPAR